MYCVIVNVKNIKLACYIIRLRYICLSTIINCFVNLTSSLIDSYHQPCTHNFLSSDDNPAPEATMFLKHCRFINRYTHEMSTSKM